MRAKEILALASTAVKWDTEDMLVIACRYIDNHQDDLAFADFVRHSQEAELDAKEETS